MLNTKHVAELIKKGEIDQIKEAMEQSLSPGSKTFEHALFELFMAGAGFQDEALTNPQSPPHPSCLINKYRQKGSRQNRPSPPRRGLVQPRPRYSFRYI